MLAKKQQKPPEPTLLERIHQLRSDIDDYINSKTQELANSRDGQGQPFLVLRHLLIHGENSCLCRAAARLLGDKDA